MEAATVEAPQHMVALAKAKARKKEVAELKRDLKAGHVSAFEALRDPRAVGAVTVGTVLLAQRNWGRRKSANFIAHIGAPSAVMAKRVESLTPRQRDLITRALICPTARFGPRDSW